MGSHTTTGEWKSFEVRMRKRRVERLLLRADVALSEGFPDDARASLEEARRLAPGLPALDEMQRRIEAPPVPASASVVARVTMRRVVPVAAAAALLAAVPLTLAMRPRTIAPAEDFRAVQVAPQPADGSPVHPASTAFAKETRAAADATSSVPAGERRTAETIDRSADLRSGASAITPVSLTTLPPVPESATRELPTTAAPATPATPPSSTDLPALSPATSTAIEPPASAVRDTQDDEAVRRTLSRYAAAYSGLDAAAAQRVWPRVDRSALARAFDALASQQVSLGDCRVDVSGALARASCEGSTTWAAKVGDSAPRTEPRRWTFDLARAGDAWQIVSARVQRR